MIRRAIAVAGSFASGGLLIASLSAGVGTASASAVLVPMAIEAPDSPVLASATPACTSPAPVHASGSFHCYTPADIPAAYGADKLHAAVFTGQGRTIVLVDPSGDPHCGAAPAILTPPHSPRY